MAHHKETKLQIVGRDEGEEFLVSGKDQIDNKIIGKKIPQTKKTHTHKYARNIQNTKYTTPKKKIPIGYHR